MVMRRRWAAMVVWCAAMVIYVVAIAGRTSFGVAGLDAIDRFGITSGVLSLFTVVQVGVYAAAQIPVGILLDKYGSRKVMVVGAIIMALGQVGLAFTTTLPLALAVRALIGLGDATAVTAVLRIIPAWFEPRRVPLLTQLTGMFGQLGQVISSLPFAYVLAHFGWTPAFLGLALLGVFAAIVGVSFIRDTPRSWKFTNIEEDDENLARHLSAALIDADAPSVKETLREPGAWLGFWTHWSMNFPQTTFLLLWGVPFLQIHNGYSAAQASATLLICTVAGIVFGPFVGQLIANHPLRRSWIVYGSAAFTIASFAIVLLWPAPSPDWTIWMLLIALGLSGCASNVGFDFARTWVHPDRLGTANGLVNMGGFLASLIAVAMIGITLDISSGGAAISSGGAALTPGDFKIAMATPVILLILGLVNVEILKNITRKMYREQGIIVPPIREVVRRYQRVWDDRRVTRAKERASHRERKHKDEPADNE